jgi:hypothetical protein
MCGCNDEYEFEVVEQDWDEDMEMDNDFAPTPHGPAGRPKPEIQDWLKDAPVNVESPQGIKPVPIEELIDELQGTILMLETQEKQLKEAVMEAENDWNQLVDGVNEVIKDLKMVEYESRFDAEHLQGVIKLMVKKLEKARIPLSLQIPF